MNTDNMARLAAPDTSASLGPPRSLETAIHGGLLAFLWAAVTSANVLAFAGCYHIVLAVLLTAVLTVWAAREYLRCASGAHYIGDLAGGASWRTAPLAALGFGYVGIICLCLFILGPLLVWPLCNLLSSVHGDILLYHLSKAINLWHTGTAWQTSTLTLYWEYPFGYESLLTLVIPFTGDERLFGPVHALVVFFLCLTIVQLIRKFTRLSTPAAWGWAAAVCFAPGLDHFLGYVGKNDVLLHAAMLSAILHAPLGTRDQRFFGTAHPLGLVMSSAVAMATKPNAIGVVLPCCAIWGWYWYRKTDRRPAPYATMKACALGLAILAPSVFWVGRNFYLLGWLMPGHIMMLKEWSIWWQRGNPKLYEWNYAAQVFVVFALLTWAGFVYSLASRRTSKAPALVSLGLLLLFIITPASAWGINGPQEWQARIMLRYATAWLAHVLIVTAMLFDKMRFPWAPLARRRGWSVAALLCAVAPWFMLANSKLPQYQIDLRNGLLLADWFQNPVGTGGYRSAYDYVREHVRDSRICFTGQLAYYCYGPGFTNRLVTDPQEADYAVAVVIEPGGPRFGMLTPYADTPENAGRWRLVYRDDHGQVFKRLAARDMARGQKSVLAR